MVSVENIRNIAFVSQSNTGKSSLIANLLVKAGAIPQIPRKEDAHSVSDFTQEEKERNFTHALKLFSCTYEKHNFNLIDTPGYPDFVGEVISALDAADAAVFVIDASGSVEVQTEQIWDMVKQKNLPRLFFINKMDRGEADFHKALNEIPTKLEIKLVPVQAPQIEEKTFKAVIDLIEESDNIPGEFSGLKEKLTESAAETDDALVEKYLEEGKLAGDEVKKGLKTGIGQGSISPVLCGSNYSDIGIDSLAKFLINFFPDPTKRKILDKEGKEVNIADEKESLAQVFKVVSEPHLGDVALLRIFSGRFNAGSVVYNVSNKAEEKLGQKFQVITGQTKNEVDSVGMGEIVGVVKLKSTQVSDTLSSVKDGLVLKTLEFPLPNTSVAVVPKERKDEEKVSFALDKLCKEDPTLTVNFSREFSEIVLSGMGELHLGTVSKRLASKFGVNVDFKEPRVPYRETVKGSAKVQGKYKKQSGGHGQYADVWLEMEPLAKGGGFEFVDKIVGGKIPSRFIPSVEKGVKEALNKGVSAGYPVTDIRVSVVDGSFHPVDSSDIAFQIAGSMAFRDAMKQAKPTIIEPIMEVEIVIPEEYVGDVTGDINARRGRILTIEAKGRSRMIKAQIPLGELSRYASTLKSITKGRGTFQMKFSCYEEAPAHVAQKIIKESENKK
jgi:elongation factor G